MSIQGKKRENQNFENKLEIGLFPAKVVAINPTIEEYKEVLGIELKEDSKAADYLGEKDGNTTLRIDFWLKETKREVLKKVTFFLEDKERENKDQTKKQYINITGASSWASDESGLPTWFTKTDYKVAHSGESDLYDFMRYWLGDLDFRSEETKVYQEWKTLMKGNLNALKEQIDGGFDTPFVSMAIVKTVEKDGETKQYQGVYNKTFLPEYALKQFRLVDYHKPEVQEALKRKDPKKLAVHEKFVLSFIGEYGCKDEYLFKDIQEYDPSQSIVASGKALEPDSAEY